MGPPRSNLRMLDGLGRVEGPAHYRYSHTPARSNAANPMRSGDQWKRPWRALRRFAGGGKVVFAVDCLPRNIYPIIKRFALPPAAAVFVLTERSCTSHSSG